ncbi:MAG TPA: SPW repeat protein [Actinomycetales bacterium]|jgi:hypothetical protein|nr:SPW repeat protein [Actinomycetales bacterium]
MAMSVRTRWQDWVVLAIGVYCVIAPFWTTTESRATWSLVVLGVLLAVSALWSLGMPGVVGAELTHAILGILLLVSPWVMAFTELTTLTWTAWIGGGVALVMGVWALPESRAVHRTRGGTLALP